MIIGHNDAVAFIGNTDLQGLRRGIRQYRWDYPVGLDPWRKSKSLHERVTFFLWIRCLHLPSPRGTGNGYTDHVPLGLLGDWGICLAGRLTYADP